MVSQKDRLEQRDAQRIDVLVGAQPHQQNREQVSRIGHAGQDRAQELAGQVRRSFSDLPIDDGLRGDSARVAGFSVSGRRLDPQAVDMGEEIPGDGSRNRPRYRSAPRVARGVRREFEDVKADFVFRKIGREIRRRATHPDAFENGANFFRLGVFVDRLQQRRENVFRLLRRFRIGRVRPKDRRRIADLNAIGAAPFQKAIERGRVSESGRLGNRGVFPLLVTIGREGVEVEGDNRICGLATAGREDALNGRMDQLDTAMLPGN